MISSALAQHSDRDKCGSFNSAAYCKVSLAVNAGNKCESSCRTDAAMQATPGDKDFLLYRISPVWCGIEN